MAKYRCENCGRKIKQGGRVVMPRNGIPRYFCCIQCEKEALGENMIPEFLGGLVGGF